MGEKGKPLEYFLVDPPRPVDERWGLSSRGVTLADVNGTPCVLDHVGQDSYPNVADFLEEVRRFGSSRRVQGTFDFRALGPGSRHLFVHPRAQIDNPQEYWDYGPEAGYDYAVDSLPGRVLPPDPMDPTFCVTRRADHRGHDFKGMCASLWWHDLHPDTVVYASEEGIFEKQVAWEATVKRQMPGFSYHAFSRPQDTHPRYTPAVFLYLPIHRLVVIEDPEGGAHDEALKKAEKAGLPVELESE